MNEDLNINQLDSVISLINVHLEGLSEWQSTDEGIVNEYAEYDEIKNTLEKMKSNRAIINKEEIVEIHGYVDQLISNDDGTYDDFGSSYFLVHKEWAMEMVVKQGFKDLEDFYSTYTYDDTMDWIDKAIEDGVILGVGTGIQPHLLDGGIK